MMELVFTQEEINKFRFVKTKDHVIKTGIKKQNQRGEISEVFLKDLQVVWKDHCHFFEDGLEAYSHYYAETNTIMIDNLPHKLCANPCN